MKATPHTFHIPVMGTGFTIDTPLKVARYGISSVISLVDDILIEQMRKFHCGQSGEIYEEIGPKVRDARALRITAYLNLMDRLVAAQTRRLQASPFESGSEITLYFEMLPEGFLKEEYRRMLSARDSEEKARRQDWLRSQAVPGSIDANIMTKLDRLPDGETGSADLPASDALSALRGFANSTVESSIVFSAGLNPRLYSYAAEFADFLPSAGRAPKKSIILKVSDYRSAEIQGKFLAKRGLWVSEYRIESGLNCGGHAFSNAGALLGPILEDFKRNRDHLVEAHRPIYSKALAARGIADVPGGLSTRVTVQGGIGTAAEDRFLREYYGVDGTGWGTPFLLVPEATNVDEAHLLRLVEASDSDVELSDASPLNVPFWILRDSESEKSRMERIREGKPGSPCVKRFLAGSLEFTEKALCRASRAYQKLKLERISGEALDPAQESALREHVVAKACICHDLAGGATLKLGIDPEATTTVCCGPNIVNFSRIATLKEMVDHIYGRAALPVRSGRRHMFLQELSINIDYLRREANRARLGIFGVTAAYLQEFRENLERGVEYYRNLAPSLQQGEREPFEKSLRTLAQALQEPILAGS